MPCSGPMVISGVDRKPRSGERRVSPEGWCRPGILQFVLILELCGKDRVSVMTSSVSVSDRLAVAQTDDLETWHATAVDRTRVDSRLTGQWLRLEGPRPLRLGRFGRSAGAFDSGEDAPGTYARTNTTNLLVCARSSAQAARAQRALAGLQAHYPTRAIVVVSDPALERRSLDGDPNRDDDDLTISTTLIRPDTRSPRASRFESVTITGGPRRIGNPLHTAIPLCLADLPTVVWWMGDLQYDLGVFQDLAQVSDRMIVDSSGFGDTARGLLALAGLMSPESSTPALLADFSWSRIHDWRNVIAQFYDAPQSRDALASIGGRPRSSMSLIRRATRLRGTRVRSCWSAGWRPDSTGSPFNPCGNRQVEAN